MFQRVSEYNDRAEAVSLDTVYTPPFTVLFVETGGDLDFTTPAGDRETITVPSNFKFDMCRVEQLHSTTTTATGITGFRV